MATQVNVKLVDDLDGSAAEETVAFGLDGRNFEVDLSKEHATQLRDALASFVAVARRGDGKPRRRTSPSAEPRPTGDRERTAAVRQWAAANGYTVSARGRIAKTVMEAYENRAAAVPSPAEEGSTKKKPRKRSSKNAA